MKKLRQVARQLDARLRADSPQLARDEKTRQESLVWRGLTMLSSGTLAPFFVPLFAAWTFALIYGVGLVRGDPNWIHLVLVIGVALVQYAFQLALVLLAQLLYMNYGWLCALARYAKRLFQQEFPAPDEPPSGALSQAYQECVEAQWERLQSMLERYRARATITLENDLASDERLYPENATRLMARGYLVGESEPVRLTVCARSINV